MKPALTLQSLPARRLKFDLDQRARTAEVRFRPYIRATSPIIWRKNCFDWDGTLRDFMMAENVRSNFENRVDFLVRVILISYRVGLQTIARKSLRRS